MYNLTYDNLKKKNRYVNQKIDKKFKNRHFNQEYFVDDVKAVKHTCTSRKNRAKKRKRIQLKLSGSCIHEPTPCDAPEKDQIHYHLPITTDISEEISCRLFFNIFFQNKKNKELFPVLWSFGKIFNSNSFKLLETIPSLLQWTKFVHYRYNENITKEKCFKDYKKTDDEWHFEDSFIQYANDDYDTTTLNLEIPIKDKIPKDPAVSTDKCIKIGDVFKHCSKFNWRKISTAKDDWNRFRAAWNKVSNVYPEFKPIRSSKFDHEIPITNSLFLSQDSDIKLMIDKLIRLHNNFLKKLNKLNSGNEKVSFFNLRKHDLLDSSDLFRIILAGIIKTKKESICKTQIFDLKNIEYNAKRKMLAGRKVLDIDFTYFKFLEYPNLLPKLDELKIKPLRLSDEILHKIDKNLRTNYRKRIEVLDTFSAIIKCIDSRSSIETDKIGLYEFMDNIGTQHELKYCQEDLKMFKDEKIELKHVYNIWFEMIKRMDEQFSFNDNECLLCYYPLSDEHSIELECCNRINGKLGGLCIHYSCLKDYLNSKSVNSLKGNKISLNSFVCINCNNPMEYSNEPNLFSEINEFRKKLITCIKKTIMDEAKQDKIEIKDNVDELIEEANRKYAFYACNYCGDPYYGGYNECNDFEDKSKKEDRVCNKCKTPSAKCKIHDSFQLKQKCRYCCSPATFFCFGTTSFCEECHRFGNNSFNSFPNAGGTTNIDHRAGIKNGKRIAWKCGSNKEDHKCPLGIKHPPHGQEFYIGCALCNTEFVNKVTANWLKFVGLKYQ